MGKPQKAFRSVLVAGTNGKGSTAAMIASIVRAGGYRVGLYTSPHLRDVRERIQINGKSISEEKLTKLIRHLRLFLSKGRTKTERITYFEFLTALAFVHFNEEKVDLAVLETGLGGRLDAANTVDPLISVITSIEHDHTEYLGKDILSIAQEKAGILRSGKTAVVSRQRQDVSPFLTETCRTHQIDLWLHGRDFNAEVRSWNLGGSRLDFSSIIQHYRDLKLPLTGRHQGDNAATAIAVCCRLKDFGMILDERAIRQGLAETKWPGRLEVAATDPLILLDGAHNPAATLALKEALEELFPTQEKFIIFGVLQDKNSSEMIATLAPLAKEIIFVPLRTNRGADPAKVACETVQGLGKSVIMGNLSQSLSYVTQKVSKNDIICVTGSFYAVGEALEALETFKDIEKGISNTELQEGNQTKKDSIQKREMVHGKETL